jgi:hypothetical protein
MMRSQAAKLAAVGCAAVLASACSTLKIWAPSTMERPRTDALGTSSFDTLTQHNDPQRTGANLNETRLNPQTVASGKFERLFDWEVDGQIYTQPLYVSDVPYRKDGVERRINLVIVATTNNSVYAFEAPSADSNLPPSEAPLWHLDSGRLGRALPYDFFVIDWGVLGHNIKPKIGITATPVVDRQRQLVYVTVKAGFRRPLAYLKDPSYRLFAIDLLSGQIVAGVEIGASGGMQATAQAAAFDAKHHLQRPGLLEANDRIYLAFGSHQDTLPYHGWVFAYDAETLRFAGAYCTTCNPAAADDCTSGHCEGGIWQAGGGPASDAQGNVYVMSGNGSYGEGIRGNSFIKLDKDLKEVGSWTPANYGCLNRTDSDLGSSGPTYLKDQRILVGGGKEGVLYALSEQALAGPHMQPGTSGTRMPCGDDDPVPLPSGTAPRYWSIQASPAWNEKGIMDVLRIIDPSAASQGYHHIHGSPVQWTVHSPGDDRDHLLLYVSAERDKLRAYEFDDGFKGGRPPPQDPTDDTYHSRCTNSDHGMPGGFLTISANGTEAASGIVWAAMPRRDLDALNHTVRGVLRAYQAFPDREKVLKEIWNSDTGVVTERSPCTDGAGGSNQLGDFAKFAPPTVAEGKVYVSTFSHRLVVYGIRQPGAVEAPEQPYDALLDLDQNLVKKTRPDVEPGDPIEVRITATNTGTGAWRIDDDIRLGSQTMPAAEAEPVEGADVLKLTREIRPGQQHVFAFHLKAPPEEGSHDLTWRLVRKAAGGKPQQSAWFGTTTSDWEFNTLKADCVDLRDRARGYISQIRSRTPPDSLQGEILDLKAQAERRGCSLHVGVDPSMSH